MAGGCITCDKVIHLPVGTKVYLQSVEFEDHSMMREGGRFVSKAASQ